MKARTRRLIEMLKGLRKPEKARSVFFSGNTLFVHYTVWRCPRCGAGDFDLDTPHGAYMADCPECGEHVLCGPTHIDDCGEALVIAGEKKMADKNGTIRCTVCGRPLDYCDCGAAGCTFCPPGVMMVTDERRRWQIIDDTPIKPYQLCMKDVRLFAEISGSTPGTLVVAEERRVSP